MFNRYTVFWLGLAAVAGGVLFSTSYEVQALEEDLARLNRQIIAEQEAIRVLKAEWGYLNEPDRLEASARAHLPLRPTQADQIAIDLNRIPMRTTPLVVVSPQVPPAQTAPVSVPVATVRVTPAPASAMNDDPEETSVGDSLPREELRQVPVTTPAPVPASLPMATRRPAPAAINTAQAGPPSAAADKTAVRRKPVARPIPQPAPTVPAIRPDDQIGLLLAKLGANQ